MASYTKPPQEQLWTKDTAQGSDSLILSSNPLAIANDKSFPSNHVTSRTPLEIRSISRKRPRHYIKTILCFLVVAVVAAPWIKMTLRVTSKRADDEPNPPALPSTMVLLRPPSNEREIQSVQAVLAEYSDPILYWNEFSNSSFKAAHGFDGDESANENHPLYTYTSSNHFSSKRTALLFTPGIYPIDIEIGYYTSLYGLGPHPNAVLFTGDKGPHVPALDKFTDRPPFGSGLNTFWRSMENIATRPSGKGGMTWAVSQAAPLRRMHIHGDLNLFDAGAWLSGGMGANMVVDGEVNFGGQQQWIMRNVHLKKGAVGGAWSLVFVGCEGNVPEERTGMEGSGPSVSLEENPRVRMEKPFIVLKDRQLQYSQTESVALDDYELELRVPKVSFGKDAVGPQFYESDEEVRNFRRVNLGVPSTSLDPTIAAIENHSILQKALDQGKDLVLSPGIYSLSSSLEVKYPNQVILGLAFATLIAPSNGMPCIHVHSKVPGVRIAGVMLEASVLSSEGRERHSSLLQWGEDGVLDGGDEDNPGLLSDVFARVGGSSLDRSVSTDVMVVLHSENVIGDNVWLWRADHVALRPGEEANFPRISPLYRQTVLGECQVKNGLIVNGANVTIFGLAVEHTTEDQIIWNGDNGK
eukprot:CCRYP_008936-RD/>CCRYP_008936-RD protein AED:0.04 eAED:0.04 QI:74/1/1/1/1/0.83/6/1739/637